jgi:hypothetical protein
MGVSRYLSPNGINAAEPLAITIEPAFVILLGI